MKMSAPCGETGKSCGPNAALLGELLRCRLLKRSEMQAQAFCNALGAHGLSKPAACIGWQHLVEGKGGQRHPRFVPPPARRSRFAAVRNEAWCLPHPLAVFVRGGGGEARME